MANLPEVWAMPRGVKRADTSRHFLCLARRANLTLMHPEMHQADLPRRAHRARRVGAECSARCKVDCASFTLVNLQSELGDLRSDAHLVLQQLSAEYHPQEAGYDHRTLFATSQLTMTPPNLLAHLRRATSSISTISTTASPANPMAQARRGIGLRCGGPEVRVRVSGCGPPRDHHHHPSCAQGFDLDPHYVDLHHVVAFGSRRPQRSCSTLATHMVPTLGRSGSVRGVY